jgi:hypothetical protein
MTTYRYSILLMAAAMLNACSHAAKKDFAGFDTGADQATCEAHGGKRVRVCGDGYVACVTPYPDGGKPCADSSECLGTCYVPAAQSVFPSGKNKGICQKTTAPCECYRKVIHGEVERGGNCPA